MPQPPDVTTGSSGGRWQPHVATTRLLGGALVVLALAVWWRGMPIGGPAPGKETCVAPVAAQVADWTTSAAIIAQVRFDGTMSVSDGTTDTDGWQVMIRTASATSPQPVQTQDTAPAQEQIDPGLDGDVPAAGTSILVWPGIGDGTPNPDEGLMLWLNPHEGTTVDGSPVLGFDVVGVLAIDGTSARQMCRDSRSRPVPLDQVRAATRR